MQDWIKRDNLHQEKDPDNLKEQGKKKNYLLRGDGEQDGNPSHPPPIPQWQLWGQDPRVFRKRFVEKVADFRKKWRI
jgi:hypothetical protein